MGRQMEAWGRPSCRRQRTEQSPGQLCSSLSILYVELARLGTRDVCELWQGCSKHIEASASLGCGLLGPSVALVVVVEALAAQAPQEGVQRWCRLLGTLPWQRFLLALPHCAGWHAFFVCEQHAACGCAPALGREPFRQQPRSKYSAGQSSPCALPSPTFLISLGPLSPWLVVWLPGASLSQVVKLCVYRGFPAH